MGRSRFSGAVGRGCCELKGGEGEIEENSGEGGLKGGRGAETAKLRRR